MKYLIFGANGQLGSKFAEEFTLNGVDFSAYGSDECNISEYNEVKEVLQADKPSVILNCAAYNLVDQAEINNVPAFLVNQTGAENIAKAAEVDKTFFVHFSTDYVFDGTKGTSYTELDRTNPINEYGKSKLAGENIISDILDNYLIFRLSWVYGKGRRNFIFKLLQWASTNNSINITSNETSIPSSTDMIVSATINAIKAGLNGLYHLTPNGKASRFEWAKEVVRHLSLKVQLNPVEIEHFNLPAKRPPDTSMSNNILSKEIGEFHDWKYYLRGFLTEV